MNTSPNPPLARTAPHEDACPAPAFDECTDRGACTSEESTREAAAVAVVSLAEECRIQAATGLDTPAARGTLLKAAAALEAIAAPAPDELQYALDRMATPLDPSRLGGVTAAEDARCMQVIRAAIDQFRARIAELEVASAPVSEELQYALKRLVAPLDPLRLGRAGADEDARCVRIIDTAVEQFRRRIAELEATLRCSENERMELLNRTISQLERERNALAAAIHGAAIKLGICREDAAVTGPELLMLCNDMASGPSSATSGPGAATSGAPADMALVPRLITEPIIEASLSEYADHQQWWSGVLAAAGTGA